MYLRTFLDKLPEKYVTGSADGIDIKGVAYDPLRTKPGFLFVAINTYTQLNKVEIPDGHDKIRQAITKGATAIVVQRDMDLPDSVVKIVVPNSRNALAVASNLFYGHPSRKLKLLGITGTNGKTTTTHIVESILILKYKIGLIGTLYYKLQGVIHKSKDTTPEPPDLQMIFKEMADQNFDYCVLEASSHGIDFHRLDGCRFEAAAFTNLSQDHLDFHKTMENYLATKTRLFSWLAEDKYAIINVDDPVADRFIKATRAQILTYGIRNDADVMAKHIDLGIQRTHYVLKTPKGEVDINARLVGKFNVHNALAATAIALSQGLDLDTIKMGLESQIRVSGRFELVDKGQPFSVVVDYAHTPDGLENVLRLARDLNPRRLITVFGCGGDRDKEKRPIMGRIASDYSDEIIITADNPRNEDPQLISNSIAEGIAHQEYKIILDRKEAIRKAILSAGKGDIVMICGKGHETTQTIKKRTFHFNDVETALEILKEIH
ncbi:UDP-N-acetylmuramoyl-L-alanyl-D-glutamate--2,6-diaminopimelate ligase [candidate division KSB1 bacterium]|nr:UDP-N-acetylmuramoyl-L-alanyl-D-glutamate--2,6-diaminopimelate ligase [candidate division KSB1 bacterium]